MPNILKQRKLMKRAVRKPANLEKAVWKVSFFDGIIESMATIPAETAKSRLNNEATHIELIPAKIILREFKIIKKYRLSIILIKFLHSAFLYKFRPCGIRKINVFFPVTLPRANFSIIFLYCIFSALCLLFLCLCWMSLFCLLQLKLKFWLYNNFFFCYNQEKRWSCFELFFWRIKYGWFFDCNREADER